MRFFTWLLPWKAKKEIARLNRAVSALTEDANKYTHEKRDHYATRSELVSVQSKLAESLKGNQQVKNWIIATHSLDGEMRTTGKPVDVLNRINKTLGVKEDNALPTANP